MSSWPQPTSKLEAEDKKRYQLYVAELKAADLENMTRDDFFRHMARIVSPPAPSIPLSTPLYCILCVAVWLTTGKQPLELGFVPLHGQVSASVRGCGPGVGG